MTDAPFRFDQAWEFGVDRATFWDAIEHTENFPRWWGWLADFESGGLESGSRAVFDVRSPLPFSLSLTVEVLEVVEEQLVATRVGGDLTGPARLELEDAAAGCRARLLWELEPNERLLAATTRLAKPVVVWAHDQIVQLGLAQFERIALRHRR